MPICIYETGEKDYTGNGLGVLTPTACAVTEEAGGEVGAGRNLAGDGRSEKQAAFPGPGDPRARACHDHPGADGFAHQARGGGKRGPGGVRAQGQPRAGHVGEPAGFAQ